MISKALQKQDLESKLKPPVTYFLRLEEDQVRSFIYMVTSNILQAMKFDLPIAEDDVSYLDQYRLCLLRVA